MNRNIPLFGTILFLLVSLAATSIYYNPINISIEDNSSGDLPININYECNGNNRSLTVLGNTTDILVPKESNINSLSVKKSDIDRITQNETETTSVEFSDQYEYDDDFDAETERNNGTLADQDSDYEVNLDSMNYKGCDSFLFDQLWQRPDDWNSFYETAPEGSNIKVVRQVDEHRKVLCMNRGWVIGCCWDCGDCSYPECCSGELELDPSTFVMVNRSLGTVENGTIEFWYRFDNLDNLNLLAGFNSTGSDPIFSLGTQDGFIGSLSGEGSPEPIETFKWYNIKIEFRCNDTTNEWRNLTEGSFNWYLDGVKCGSNVTFMHNSTTFDTIGFAIAEDYGSMWIDAVGWNWGLRELDELPYQLGDKDIQWTEYIRMESYNIEFPYNYKQLYNGTMSLNITLNKELKTSFWNIFKIMEYYGYDCSGYEVIECGIYDDIQLEGVTATALQMFNNTIEDANKTNVKFAILLSNLKEDFNMDVSFDFDIEWWKNTINVYANRSYTMNTSVTLTNNIEYGDGYIIRKKIIEVISSDLDVLEFGCWSILENKTTTVLVTIEEIELIKTLTHNQAIKNLRSETIFGVLKLRIKIINYSFVNKTINCELKILG